VDRDYALKCLETLRDNFNRLAKQVDLGVMPPEVTDALPRDASAGPFLRAAWFARQGFYLSVWSLWEYYARVHCERLKSARGLPSVSSGDGSCVKKVGRALRTCSVAFPQEDWFEGANALRNLFAHYGGLVAEPKAGEFLAKAKEVAFPGLALFADGYVAIENCHVSSLQWEVGEFIREV
jgi:hypothetical protein